MRSVADEDEPPRHGIAGGGYDNLGQVAFGHPCPWLECLCGFSTPSGAADCWEEAGALLDLHLADPDAS